MITISESKCDNCLTDQQRLLPFTKVIAVRDVKARDSNGRPYDSAEPVLSSEIDLCYPCYKQAVKEHRLEAMAL